MTEVTLVIGGQRSGKSRYAQNLAEQYSKNPLYVATARIWDEEFAQRVQRHQQERGPHWTTHEEEVFLSRIPLQNQTVLLDCITLWLTNLFYDHQYNRDLALEQAMNEWHQLMQKEGRLIVVSNEIGTGVIPSEPSTRAFVDLQGWMNQEIAKSAQQVILMVAGIPFTIKNLSSSGDIL